MRELLTFILVLMVAAVFGFAGFLYGQERTMQEAAERGYATECVGTIGYYWECEQ
jgi:hypothetical protein